MDQGCQAGSENDAAEQPPVPPQRGTSVAECPCLQLGESLATIGAAAEDQELVADEFAVAVGEGRRTAGETCKASLALAGRGVSESEAVRQSVEIDCGAAAARRLAKH